MGGYQSKVVEGTELPALPMAQNTWEKVVRSLGLPPQQARIVELILRNYDDKAIALKLGVKRTTVRTYLGRAFDRLGVRDRTGLILYIFSHCMSACPPQGRHPEE